MSCRCAHPKPVTRHGVMGRGGVFCGICGRDLEAERFVVKLEDLPPHVAEAADPYLPLDRAPSPVRLPGDATGA